MTTFLSRLLRRPGSSAATWIEIDDLRRHLDANEPAVPIDVRQPEEFTAPPGHLPGAINVPLAELSGRIAEVSAHQKPIVLVCKTDRRSARVAEILIAAGVPDVSILRGGTDGWHERGLPLD
ncbi:MAG: rhodanese-like domain-containing protein [Acetobacteraceae bacterium]|nr:rhodanese-like domain-containing protein [Acetobacteraceae bacterium]